MFLFVSVFYGRCPEGIGRHNVKMCFCPSFCNVTFSRPLIGQKSECCIAKEVIKVTEEIHFKAMPSKANVAFSGPLNLLKLELSLAKLQPSFLGSVQPASISDFFRLSSVCSCWLCLRVLHMVGG